MSPWPLVSSISALLFAVCFVLWMKGNPYIFLFIGMTPLLLSAVQWWRDVIRESTMMGEHTLEVCKGLYIGFTMFILSEVMFFFSFFFSYFFVALSPDPMIGGMWPPLGVQTVSFLGVPLSNTMILLSSGVSVTWAHHSLLSSKKGDYVLSLSLTIVLAFLFLSFQYKEYFEMSFSISDSVYGSLFFIMTGFHGMHVIVGTIFLIVSLFRGMNGHFSRIHHLGFEFSAWYWHFVDVVWLFLYIIVYWWGG